MWRTFTDAVPKARKGQLDRFFLQKRYFICILSSKILKTGPKADKNTLFVPWHLFLFVPALAKRPQQEENFRHGIGRRPGVWTRPFHQIMMLISLSGTAGFFAAASSI